MKTVNLIKKATLLTGVAAAVTLGIFQSSKATNQELDTNLNQLVSISNANAEGEIKCGSAGSGCKYTVTLPGGTEEHTSNLLKEKK